MEVRAIQLAGKFAGIFSSGTILLVGSMVLFKYKSFDFEPVLMACKLGITAGLVVGFLGYMIGRIFERSAPAKGKSGTKKNSDLLLDDILNDDLNELSKSNE